jgi:hypothetical protein
MKQNYKIELFNCAGSIIRQWVGSDAMCMSDGYTTFTCVDSNKQITISGTIIITKL